MKDKVKRHKGPPTRSQIYVNSLPQDGHGKKGDTNDKEEEEEGKGG